MSHWPLHDAKARLSELIREAAEKGPQIVTYHGEEKAVLMSIADYRKLEAARPSLKDYLLAGPALDERTIAAINDRPRDPGRDIEA